METRDAYTIGYEDYDQHAKLSLEDFQRLYESFPGDSGKDFLEGHLDAYRDEVFDRFKNTCRAFAEQGGRDLEAIFLGTLQQAAKIFAEEMLNGGQ